MVSPFQETITCKMSHTSYVEAAEYEAVTSVNYKALINNWDTLRVSNSEKQWNIRFFLVLVLLIRSNTYIGVNYVPDTEIVLWVHGQLQICIIWRGNNLKHNKLLGRVEAKLICRWNLLSARRIKSWTLSLWLRS